MLDTEDSLKKLETLIDVYKQRFEAAKSLSNTIKYGYNVGKDEDVDVNSLFNRLLTTQFGYI